ncbi:MAG: cyclic nucleotide-binding protein [Bacteroidetes bacterium]|nr:cyclic nucleotide-binding protein [Bacteroidota bacterium]
MSQHHKSDQHLLLIEKVLLLKSIDIFEATPETVLTEVAEILEEVQIEKGTPVFRVDDIANCMYVIYKGEIRIDKDGHTLAVLKENDIFGELSLLDTETRSANATANTGVFLLRMDQEPFYELMENRIEVARGIIKTLCRRLRAQNLKSVENSLKK